MEYNYPKFTPEMKLTHTILIPNMPLPSSGCWNTPCATTATSVRSWATAAAPWHSLA